MTIKATRVPNPFGGTDYRIGDFVVIREDEPSVDEYDAAVRDVTWGAIPADQYDRMQGDVGLPDAKFEAGTLRAVRQWIEGQIVNEPPKHER